MGSPGDEPPVESASSPGAASASVLERPPVPGLPPAIAGAPPEVVEIAPPFDVVGTVLEPAEPPVAVVGAPPELVGAEGAPPVPREADGDPGDASVHPKTTTTTIPRPGSPARDSTTHSELRRPE